MVRSTNRPLASSRRTFSSILWSGTIRPLTDCMISVVSEPLADLRWTRSGPSTTRCPLMSTDVCLLTLDRSEEHTSELQSHLNLVCRLLLEKKKNTGTYLLPLILIVVAT